MYPAHVPSSGWVTGSHEGAAAMYPHGESNESGITDYLDNRYQIKHAVYFDDLDRKWAIYDESILFHDMLRLG